MFIVWSDDATQAQISEAGLWFFAVCYGGNAGDSLNHLRYEKYMDMDMVVKEISNFPLIYDDKKSAISL